MVMGTMGHAGIEYVRQMGPSGTRGRKADGRSRVYCAPVLHSDFCLVRQTANGRTYTGHIFWVVGLFSANGLVGNESQAHIGGQLPICHPTTILRSVATTIEPDLPKDGDGKPRVLASSKKPPKDPKIAELPIHEVADNV